MRRLTHEEFVKRVKTKFPGLDIVSEYKSTRTPVRMRCKKTDELGKQHGTFIVKDPSAFLYNKQNRNGCKKCANKTRSITKTKHFYDPDYFHSPNLENCYWAGFIAADGCIHQGGKHISIKLSSKDQAHLELLMENVGYSGRTYSGKSNLSGKQHGYATLFISNAQKWVHDLQNNFGIGPQKSLTYTHPENLTDEQSLAFIKGYIDGDGHISLAPRPRIGAIGTLETLTWIQQHFDRIAPAQSLNKLVAKPRKIKGCNGYYYEVGHKRAERIISMLRKIPTPRLERKWS